MDGIKSKERVKQHGEVFTPDSIVNDMIGLIDSGYIEDGITPESYILKTYLEPACGNGNFLIRLLDRKLAAVRLLEKEKQETGLIQAVSSIYGIDIQEDNVHESIERMMELIKNGSVEVLELQGKDKRPFYNGGKFEMSPKTEEIVKFILEKNIVLGNALETDETKAAKLFNWNFNGDKVNPQIFYMTNVDNDIDIGNTATHWKYLMELNYVHDDSTLDMDF